MFVRYESFLQGQKEGRTSKLSDVRKCWLNFAVGERLAISTREKATDSLSLFHPEKCVAKGYSFSSGKDSMLMGPEIRKDNAEFYRPVKG